MVNMFCWHTKKERVIPFSLEDISKQEKAQHLASGEN